MSFNKTRYFGLVAIFLASLSAAQTRIDGTIEGKIGLAERGGNGFGYDPLFIPEGYTRTYAELTLDEKNRISHRGLAVQKFRDFLDTSGRSLP